MSFFSFNRGGQSNFWNFSQKEKEDYSVELVGYLVELSDPPATKFGSRTIDRWDDGNPKRNIRFTVLNDNGVEYNWDFNPGGADKSASGGEDKRSAAMKAVTEAIHKVLPDATGIEDILGMRIRIVTEEPPGNFTYSRQNPRPWHIQVNSKSTVEHRGVVHKPDWEREGGAYDAAEPAPAQQGDGTKEPSQEFLANEDKVNASMQAARAASMANQASNKMNINPGPINAQDETPPVTAYQLDMTSSVYDDDIPF